MRSKWKAAIRWAALAAVAVSLAAAQEPLRASIDVRIPPDAPVALVAAESGDSRGTARGSALLLYVNSTLTLQNVGTSRIRAVTFLVRANELAAGGKGSVTVPNLDVAPQASFPVRIELSLMSPLPSAQSPRVEVLLDGVLFDNLAFYGPDRLNCRRTMTVWELEARRDRHHLLAVLARGGETALQQELLGILQRQASGPRLGVRVSRTARATNLEGEQQLQFAFLRLPGAPVEPLRGLAAVAGNRVRSPRVEVKNSSRRPVRHVELGWILRDARGREFLAGAMPSDVPLKPGQRATLSQHSDLVFHREAGTPLEISGLTAFVSSVEFDDGSVWVPTREELNSSPLNRILGPTAEEERLVLLYRKKGLRALIEELRRLQ